MNPTLCDSSPAFVDGRVERAVGSPWVPLGRDLSGFDCWGFVRYALGLTDAPDAPFFNMDERPGQVRRFSQDFQRVPDRTPYSIALLGTGGQFYHVGVYLPSGFVYHCMERSGVCGHRFRSLGILGFDSFEFYLWGQNAKHLQENKSLR